MRRKVTFKQVISAVKLSLLLVWCWPHPRDSSKLRKLCIKLYYFFCITMEICLILPLIRNIKNNLEEPQLVVHSVVFISALVHTGSYFIFYMINQHHLQNVAFEMEEFSVSMKPHEEVLIQRYIDRYVIFHGAAIICFYLGSVSSVAQTFALNETFLTHAEYPFDVYYQPMTAIIFLQQTISSLIVASQLCTNVFMALLLWYTIARFELLNEELTKATHIYDVYKCVEKHEKLFKYAAEVALITRPFAFTSVCCATVVLVMSFLLYVTKQPFLSRLPFFAFSMVCISEVYMYTWAAEYLMYMSHEVAYTAFYLIKHNYVTNFMDIWKCLQIIIMRSQKPIIISIPCFMPALSLNYFSSYCSTTLSYFTALRVLM